MPEATARIWSQMGLGDIKKLDLSALSWGQLPLGTKLGEVQPVFPRADKSAIERMQKMEEEQRSTPVTETAPMTPVQGKVQTNAPLAESAPVAVAAPVAGVPGSDKISIDDFAKIEL